jgi:uncharacterized protein involved in propanediol utilization
VLAPTILTTFELPDRASWLTVLEVVKPIVERAVGVVKSVAAGVGVSHGSFGELLQGALTGDDQDFLVTLPIVRRSTVRITLRSESDDLRVEPRHKRKSLWVAQAILQYCGISSGGLLEISSELPEGKGMASSSADLIATARAVGDLVGVEFTAAEIEGFLRGVEPTDGLMYEGVVAFYHRQVRLCRTLSDLPALTIVGIDEGGQLDTVEFNASRPAIGAHDRREYAELLESLTVALAAGDLSTIGSVSTRSAILNQKRCTKRYLGELLAICCGTGGLGVTVAHSGTIIGVLLSDEDPLYEKKILEVKSSCAQLSDEVLVDYTIGSSLPIAPQ